VRDLADDRHALIRFVLRSALSAFPRKKEQAPAFGPAASVH